MESSAVEATLQWETMIELLDEFVGAWKTSDEAPQIHDFLATKSRDFRAVALVELIKIDLKQRYATGRPKSLEEYIHEHPELLTAGEPPVDLIYEEFHQRRLAGEQPQAAEYEGRFPRQAASLRRLLAEFPSDCSSSLLANAPPGDFQPGDKLDEFVLITKLGAGAFAKVYLARQQSMQRMVALKVSANSGSEAETLAQLDHPHIIRVYDQRRLPELRLRLVYMQFLPGGTLKDVIDLARQTPLAERRGVLLLRSVDAALERAGYPALENNAQRRRMEALPWAALVCRTGAQLAVALDFAHAKGVLHRDVKPANVLLTADGVPKLADFNTSFAAQLTGVTAEASFGGSLPYMSPEQLEAFNPEHDRTASSLDGRADLFSLAAMLWELLLAVRPFDESNLARSWSQQLVQMAERRRLQIPTPPEPLRDPVTRDLVAVLQRALLPNREDRPATGAELARELRWCLYPRTRTLLQRPRARGWQMALAWPLITVISLILLPNAIAGASNFLYNQAAVAAVDPRFLGPFHTVSYILNAVYFSFGALLAKWIIGPVASAAWQCEWGEPPNEQVIRRLRLRALRFGSIAAMLGILLWFSSGVAFPVMIWLFAPDFPSRGFRPFFASMPICGLIAAAYPFFGVTLFVVRVLYPALLRAAPGTEQDELQLRRLARGLTPYLVAAGVIPLLIMFMVITMSAQMDARARFVSGAIILAGLLGLAVSFLLYQRLRDDIAALLVAVRPLDTDIWEEDHEAA